MVFRFHERPNSRSSTATPPSVTLEYVAAGTQDEEYVRQFAHGSMPFVYAHENGILYRQDFEVEPEGYDTWGITAKYGPRKREVGSYSLSFDTTGGNIHIKTSKQTRAKYGVNVEDNDNLIGVNGEDVEGTDIVVPALKLQVNFRHPLGVISLARIKELAYNTAAINSTNFMTFAPGEVLFLGASGAEGTDTETEVTYQFACAQNQEGLAIGQIAGITKRGWDYIWITWEDNPKNGVPVKSPKFVYVERVYEEVDLASVLGFGG
jgi:hypothetical protein